MNLSFTPAGQLEASPARADGQSSRSVTETSATTSTASEMIEIPDLSVPKTPKNLQTPFIPVNGASESEERNPYGSQPLDFRMGAGSSSQVNKDQAGQGQVLYEYQKRQNQIQQGPDSQQQQQQQQQYLPDQVPEGQPAQLQMPVVLKRPTKTPPSYTLNILVRQFTKQAERKLNLCLNAAPLDQEPDIVALLSEGIDPTFDRTIAALGYIARKSRKRVTDAVMHWRRGKSELREMARTMLEKEILAQREAQKAAGINPSAPEARDRSHSSSLSINSSNSSSVSAYNKAGHSNSNSRGNNSVGRAGAQGSIAVSSSNVTTEPDHSKVERAEITFTQADRQLSISTYILWRVLIEVVRQSPRDTDDSALEEITYNYLRSMDPFMVSQSLIHAANWSLLADLLGEMSTRSFVTVSDRFIADLEKFPAGYGKDHITDASLNLLIHGMRSLRLSNTSLEKFEEGADFMKSIAKFFRRCENERLFGSYCEVLTELLLSLAGTLTAEVNHPTWIDAIKMIYAKAIDISNRNTHLWIPATQLVVASLCVSPKSTFDRRWLPLAESLILRLKPKTDTREKVTVVLSVARLLWAYLYRYSDTLNAKTRKMEYVSSLLLAQQPHNKKGWLTSDPVLIQATAQVFRNLAYSQLNFTLENVLLPALKHSFNGVSLENLHYDAAALCIRGYSCILWDHQQGEQPPFPTDDVIEQSLDPLQFSNESVEEVFSSSSSNAAVHAEVSGLLRKLLFLLDERYGSRYLEMAPLSANAITQRDVEKSHSRNNSSGNGLQRLTSLYFHGDQSKKYRGLDLFTTDIAAVTWHTEGDPAVYRKIVEQLVRNTIHSDDTVAAYCIDALKLLIGKKHPGVVTSVFATSAFFLNEKAASFLNHSYTSSDQYVRLLEVYVETLNSWLETLAEPEETEEDSADDLYNVNAGFTQQNTPSMPKYSSLQLKNIVNIIDDVEGNGLFFFLCHDSRVRYLGAQILRLVTQFDQVLLELTSDGDKNASPSKGHGRARSKFAAEFGTRAIQVLESLDLVDLVKPKKHLLSEAELKRYGRHQDRKATIVKVAESGHGVDAALWFKVYDAVLEMLAKKCPIQTAIARSHSCIRLVQLYDQVSKIASVESTQTVDASLVWDYMLFLKMACCSLTSTGEQRVHLPESLPSTPKGHGRKKSQQLFTVQHQKITSAVSIFRITVPLLSAKNKRLREALVEGLSCMNVNIFRSFMETADATFEKSSTSRTFSWDETEICCVLHKTILRFAAQGDDFLDDWILSKLQALLVSVLSTLERPASEKNYRYQRLRKYFCGLLESVHAALLAKNNVDRWLPFDFRRRSLVWMLQWSGYGNDSGTFQERYRVMSAEATKQKDVSLLASLELQRHQLQYSAISCVSEICASPTKTADDSINWEAFFQWIDALFNTHNERICGLAGNAVVKVLTVNKDPESLIDVIISKCYKQESCQGYALALRRAFEQGLNVEYPAYRLFALSIYLAGSDSYTTRSNGALLAEFTETKSFGTHESSAFADGLTGRSRAIYKRAQFALSSHFATHLPAERFKIISELTRSFHKIPADSRRGLIAVLLPWVQAVDLDLSSPDSQMVLRNCADITLRYGGKSNLQNEVEALWVALGSGSNGNGTKEVFSFVSNQALNLRSLGFLDCARQVVVSIATVPGFDLVETLLAGIEPRGMVPATTEKIKPIDSEMPFVADIVKSAQSSTRLPTLSKGELYIIFLVDIVLQPRDTVKSRLPLLLHLSFILLDHQLALVRDQARALLAHLVREYAEDSPTAQSIVSSLRSPDHNLWAYSDFVSDKNSGRIPERMDTLVREVLSAFEKTNPDLQKEWSRTAIEWATSCKVMHLASRSFQVFRCLVSFLDQSMLRDMLSCLANTISDENPGIQSFALQILMTLNAVTAELFSEQLIDFPQLFWASVASLSTIHEREFVEVLSALSKFISKIDLDSDDTVQCLIATFPSKWEGRFEGLQKTVMTGLRSSNAYESSLKLLCRLDLLRDSEIIGSGPERVLMALLANMPRFLHAQTTQKFPDELVSAAEVIGQMADRNQITGLSRMLTSLVKKRFRNKEDFVAQIVNVLKTHFFPEYGAESLVFLLGLLFNKTPWVKTETMDLLKHVFRAIDLSSDEFVGLGADLIAPLLRLLTTDYVEQALEVLDEASAISASPFDKHYLMMSADNATMRKEYEKIATLFGIPDSSGWSVPMPAISTARTRSNIHSVYSTCVTKSSAEELPVVEATASEDGSSNTAVAVSTHVPGSAKGNSVDLTGDQYSEVASQVSEVASYVQSKPLPADVQQQLNRTDTVTGHQDDTDSLSNMLATLENLDSFFTKDSMDMDSYGHQYNNSVDTRSGVAVIADNEWGVESPVPDASFEAGSFRNLMEEVSPPQKGGRRRSGQPAAKDHGSSILGGEEGLFGFELLRSRKRPPKFNPGELSSALSSPRTPRTPRTSYSPRIPRSPYGRGSRFSRHQSHPRRSAAYFEEEK